MIKAILSCTPNDLYSFNLPLAVYSWAKIGIDSIILYPGIGWPADDLDGSVHRMGYAMGVASAIAPNTMFAQFSAPSDKVVTYAQCSRLYAACLSDIDPISVLITADADMCVFNRSYWDQFDYNGAINIIGADLVPPGQIPMCYIAAPLIGWRYFMGIGNRTIQQCLDDLLGEIECENFRGNYWCKDQETAYKQLEPYMMDYPDLSAIAVKHNRAVPLTQFATRRADRDGWHVTPDILDAHLPRPGYTENNFEKIVDLFGKMYPDDDHSWMVKYKSEYLRLLNTKH